MLNRLLSSLLLVLLGAGILVAWVPGGFLWYLAECAVFGLMLAWLAGWSAGKLELRWSWRFIPLLAIVALGCLQLWRGWTVYAFDTAQDTLRWAVYAVLFFLAFQLFDGEESVHAFHRLFLLFALAVAVISLWQWFGHGTPILHRGHYSTFIAVALPMGVVGMARQPRHRWSYVIASAALYASVIAGGSRAGFVLVTCELFLLFALLELSGRMAAAAVGLILIFGTMVGWNYAFGRLDEHDPYAGRPEVVAATLTMVKASPAHGYGLGTWTIVYPAFASKDFGVFINAAHNDWLQWSAEGGLPMLASILALFAGSLAMVRRVPWALGVPMVFVHCMIDFPMQGRFLPAVVFLVFGIAARDAIRRAKEDSSPRGSREPSRQLMAKAEAL
jgi:O-antigen ligase